MRLVVKARAASVAARVTATAGGARAVIRADVWATFDDGHRSHYLGPYTVTPGRTEQMLATNDMIMDGDVTIAPIPPNYGLITYNGFEIMVS